MPVNEMNGKGELLEQGWSRMQDILDQEMPNISKRRFGLWVPLSALGIAMLIIAMMYFSGEKEAKTAPVEQANPHTSFAQTTSDITVEEATVIEDSVFKGNTNEGLSGESSLGESDLNSDASELMNNVSGNGAKEHQTEDVPSSELSESQKLNQHAGDIETQIQTNSKTSVVDFTSAENKNEKSAGITNINSGMAANNRPSSEIGKNGGIGLNNGAPLINSETTVMNRVVVSSKPVNAIDVTSLDQAPLAMPIIPVAAKVKPRIGMDAFFAPHFAAPVQMQGYEFGALATMSFGRKWKVMAGASIGHYNKNGVFQLGGLSRELSVEALLVPTIPDSTLVNYPDSDPEVAYDLISYDTAQLLTEVFNYLHIPVLGQYRLTNFLSVIGGVKFSHLINAPSSRGLSAIPQFGSSAGTFDLKSSRNFLEEENILHSWDVAPVVGLAFDVGGRFAFDIQYQHGLIAYIDRPTEGDRSDYQRTLSIGLRYSFF
jgi:hypothetical protein